MEAGYADDLAAIAENAFALASAGAVGINLEDGADRPEVLCERIAATKRGAARAGVDLFVNARTDVYLKALTPPERAVEESIARGLRYRDAGADGFFVPGVVQPADIRQVVAGVPLPLNVLVRAGLPRCPSSPGWACAGSAPARASPAPCTGSPAARSGSSSTAAATTRCSRAPSRTPS